MQDRFLNAEKKNYYSNDTMQEYKMRQEEELLFYNSDCWEKPLHMRGTNKVGVADTIIDEISDKVQAILKKRNLIE